jgi:hypothetical protein
MLSLSPSEKEGCEGSEGSECGEWRRNELLPRRRMAPAARLSRSSSLRRHRVMACFFALPCSGPGFGPVVVAAAVAVTSAVTSAVTAATAVGVRVGAAGALYDDGRGSGGGVMAGGGGLCLLPAA